MESVSEVNHFERIPDEIIIIICSNLSNFDLLNFSNVCHRFHLVTCDKSFSKCLDYSRCFKLTESCLFSFLTPSERWTNVRILNLNQCYWIRNSSLMKLVKMKDLEELHLLGCPISFGVLEKILSNTRLVSLSFKWPQIDSKFDLKPHLSASNLVNLKNLVIENNFKDVFDKIIIFYGMCANVEVFYVYWMDGHSKCPPVTRRTRYESSLTTTDKPFRSKLKRVNLCGYTEYGLKCWANFKWLFCDNEHTKWEEIFLPEDGCSLLENLNQNRALSCVVLRNAETLSFTESRYLSGAAEDLHKNHDFVLRVLTDDSKLKCCSLTLDFSNVTAAIVHAIAQQCPQLDQLSFYGCRVLKSDVVGGFLDISINCSMITDLDLRGCHVSSNNDDLCSSLSNLKGLHRLAISACILAAPNFNDDRLTRNQSYSRDGIKRQRIGMQMKVTESDLKKNGMWTLAENCTSLTDLKICGSLSYHSSSVRCERCNTHLEQTLTCISRCSAIQNLALYSFQGVRNCQFLCDITKSCKKLKSLQLIDIGPSGECVFQASLMKCFSDASALRDLSLIHKQFKLNSQFYKTMGLCTNLERLLICTSYAPSRQIIKDVVEISKKLLHLFVVYMKLGATSQLCKFLDDKLTSLKTERPAMSVYVGNMRNKGFPLKYQTFHLAELTSRGIVKI